MKALEGRCERYEWQLECIRYYRAYSRQTNIEGVTATIATSAATGSLGAMGSQKGLFLELLEIYTKFQEVPEFSPQQRGARLSRITFEFFFTVPE